VLTDQKVLAQNTAQSTVQSGLPPNWITVFQNWWGKSRIWWRFVLESYGLVFPEVWKSQGRKSNTWTRRKSMGRGYL